MLRAIRMFLIHNLQLALAPYVPEDHGRPGANSFPVRKLTIANIVANSLATAWSLTTDVSSSIGFTWLITSTGSGICLPWALAWARSSETVC
jgi:hypothetical protein